MFSSEMIDFAHLSESEIKTTLAKYRIALTVEEILKIQHDILKRPPTVTECVLWSIQGSEHCSYKSSRPFLKQFMTDGPNVILGPSEDAGIVELCRDNAGHRYGIVMSHESHNHPSQIVPYEGAATGVGGNVRDVSCMGAKVIASADPLRFGDIKANKTKWIHEGVVAGIAGYGNPIGVPIIAGDVFYDESYNDNCLVNVVTLGVLRDDEVIHSRAPKNSAGYNLILVGKPTDNSGFGGASFASFELKEDEKEKNKGAVQEPNAFLKRHLLKATYELCAILKEKNLIDRVGCKDLGAGGIACASVELAEHGGMGAEVNLDLVHRSMSDLHPSVLLCAETQERYLWVAPSDLTDLILEHFNIRFALPRICDGAKASVIGRIRDDGQYVVTYQGETIVHARACDVTQGLVYERPYQKPPRVLAEPERHAPINFNEIFLSILAHPNVASRAPIYEQYDKSVQGITTIEPGDADAGVMQPFLEEKYPAEIKPTGFALSVDQNPRYCKIDPYWGGVNAVAEAMRNVAAVGAIPWAITDCLNFGNPEKEDQMWEFVEAVRGVADACKGLHLKEYPHSPVPIISGNVSLYNETNGKAIAPSPVIACLGKLTDVRKAITMHCKKAGSTLCLIGERKDECGGSVYYDLLGALGALLPKPILPEVEAAMFAMTDAIDAGLVLAAHDISDGGIATTLAEMSFKNEIGCEVVIPSDLTPDTILFGETGGFVIEVDPLHVVAVRDICAKQNVRLIEIGRTTAEKKLHMNEVIDIDLALAKEAWTNGLRDKL